MVSNQVHDGIELEKVPDNADGNAIKVSKKNDGKKDLISIFTLFRYADVWDILSMIVGTIAAIGNGILLPFLMIFFTGIIDEFSKYGKDLLCNPAFNSSNFTNTSDINNAGDKLLSNMKSQTLFMIYLALVTIVVVYFLVSFWLMPSENQSLRLRKKLFESILKQDMGWFDTYKSGELTNRLTDDINKIKEATGDKLGNFIQFISTFIACVIIALVRGWKLTLVILAVSPLLLISSYLFTKVTEDLTKDELSSYAKAGAIADEVLTAIRTVFAFNGAHKEHARYNVKLVQAKKLGIRKSVYNGALLGFLWLVMFGAYGLGFWYGWTLSVSDSEQDYTVGTILLVFFLIVIGVFSLGNATPYLGTLTTARVAGYEIFQIIDRKPSIDSSSNEGKKLKSLSGNIEFRNVKFNYPSRPDSKVLNSVNLDIKPGSTVAFVGHSGCGKSTCIQLLQRFYDPTEGSVLVDNEDIKDLNVQWLRSELGVVNQEPILFGTTIKENIRFGKENVTEEDIIKAAKNSNAHDFIMELPDKYETSVGDRGGQLSGGQKQRIAIARALVRNPKILLLDEATSALDNESESIVQHALDKASSGRTTIVIAHRLSTIRNADIIYAFDKGVVVEYGTHDELMKREGVYYNLVINQQTSSDEQEAELTQTRKEDRKMSIKPDKLEELQENKADSTSEEVKEEAKEDKGPGFFQVFALNKPELLYIIIGCIAAIITGGVQPAFGVVLSKAIAVFSECDIDVQRNNINLYCIIFAVLGVTSFFSNVIQSSMFGVSGESLTKRLRSKAFKTILTQEIGWFDDKENSVGVLSTKLAVEAAAVQGTTGVRLGFALMNVANLGVGIVIAFVFSWPITLLIIAFIPLLIVGGVFQMKAMGTFAESNKSILEQSGSISNESISNIRTVVILNKQDHFVEKYSNLLDVPHRRAVKSAHLNGFILGFTNAVMFFAIAAAFALGAYLIQNNLFNQDLERIMIVFNCVLFGAQSVGQAAAILPDYAKGTLAVKSLFKLFERKSKINNWGDDKGEIIKEEEYDGEIQLKQVEFTYPARQNQQILKKIDLTIKKGQRIALVGSSGCGKSTITQLMERFYDPDEGEVTLCGKDLRSLDLYWLRDQIGIVSQEPILFDLTISENIAYGDNSRDVTKDEIVEAAKKANIHDFISKLPKAYDTNCGSKGTQLSGGQKQRIAIARALVRDPKILLLDEATSALDTESEKIVQDALDKAQVGRTVFMIAHRLSTVRNCDVIFVLKDGVVSEAGTHDELIRLGGFYAKLNKKQSG